MTQEEIKAIISTIPEEPGCYQYLNKAGTIIYVGKAKNLRKRIGSYFQKEHTDKKTRHLVRNIDNLRYFVVESEFDALILENSLIKQHQPYFNILLKDGKTYPWIVVRQEPFPRVYMTREILKDGSRYFGPYPSVQMAYATMTMIKDLYKIRTCNLNLAPHKIREGRYKVCLDYHIKKCKGPCEGLQSEEEYDRNINEIVELLKGKLHHIIDLYTKEMQHMSEEMRYEEAQKYKERLDYLKKYESKHTVAPFHISNVDVFSFDRDDKAAYINYLHIAEGMINKAYTIEYKLKMDEEPSEILATAITEIRQRFGSTAREIIIPFKVDWEAEPGITFNVPKRGDKLKLLELSLRNVKQYKVDKYKRAEKLNPEQRGLRIVHNMQADLGLKKQPRHIECFDNSNIQGTSAVASCVVFKMGKPSKKDYRKFHIKSVEGADDFATMQEVLHRRYSRLLEENAPLPDLIIVDGGKGQLNAAWESLKNLELTDKIELVGLAKRLDEIYFYNDPDPLILDKNSETLHILQQLRDEAHRFGIKFHREVRSKSQIKSELDEIPGIGAKTKDKLLAHFKSVARIKKATQTELSTVVGDAKAKIITDRFSK